MKCHLKLQFLTRGLLVALCLVASLYAQEANIKPDNPKRDDALMLDAEYVGGQHGVLFWWNIEAGARFFYIDRSIGGEFSEVIVIPADSERYEYVAYDNVFRKEGRYYYRLRAEDEWGNTKIGPSLCVDVVFDDPIQAATKDKH